MGGLRGRRLGAAITALAVGAVLVVSGPLSPAQASFASQCAAPTRTLDASATSVSIAAGETVLLASGTFTGGIDALPSGATLCVAAGAALQPAYLNNAAGSIVVAADGTASFPSISVGTGFALDVEGTATFAGLNVNGASTFTIAADAALTISGGFSPSSGTFHNAGSLTVDGAFNENSGASLDNTGVVTVNGAATFNGVLQNTGTVLVADALTVNGGAAFTNLCRVRAGGALANNASGSANAGIVIANGPFTNNGGWQQSVEGVLSATGLSDDGTVSGFGGYVFGGPTSVQGRFTGDSAGTPIQVQTQAPPGNIFDVQTGTIANVVRVLAGIVVDFEAPRPECAADTVPFADVSVTKTGPATVLENGDVSYTLTIANAGPDDAAGVVVTDRLPAEATGVVDAGGGTVAGGAVSWDIGALAVGASTTRTLTISQAAPVGTVLHDTASSTAGTDDPNPADNDGSSPDSQADTEVVAAPPPPNNPPHAFPAIQPGFTNIPLFGRMTASDPDAGQTLTYMISTQPAHGRVVIAPGGVFVYRSDVDFTGDDSFLYTVCDDGSPVLCDTSSVFLPIRPTASDDTARTFEDTAVVIPVAANDSLGAVTEPTLVTPPAHGTVTVDAATGNITYTPAAGYTGTDTFDYERCSPTDTVLCATATVTVTITPANDPPVVQPLHLTTVTGSPVGGTIVATDPNTGQTLTYIPGAPPRSGTAVVDGAQTTYSPRRGFTGTETYPVIVCDDGDPMLCATATVTVDVYPIANPDTATTPADTAVTIPVKANDEGASSAPVVATPPGHGTATVDGTSIVYTPAPGFVGTDMFTYTICSVLNPDLCATTTVTVTVTGTTPPVTPPGGGGGSGGDSGGGGSGGTAPSGEGALPGTGSNLPTWLLWASAAGIASGALLLRLRRRPRED
ncbi:Ig-like domain-containing protein [uncultured Leifsonia sp.]|uniref:Ig-like domain-containing protein n=1 Tax=uncultured Leifsonia sp. TaxID=340359 RepID=UPI0028D8CD98|nr:Ig-like domain-containing protein [uncultured Leifsonia sp.]